QATPWACIAAIAAYALQRPVKLVLKRHDDMRFTGKRHPYSSDYKIGLDESGKILAYDVTYYQNSGAVADLSPAIMERSLFHSTNTYYVPNVRVTGLCCKTNLPPFTAFRGFGGPQAMFVMEAAIAKAAESAGFDTIDVQQKNLLSDGDQFPYGMCVEKSNAERSFLLCKEKYEYDLLLNGVTEFNSINETQKRGISMMPICFGISFTKTMLNQAGALVHIYTDGSVAVSTGVVEMGQGVNTKIISIAARTFGIPPEKIIIENTNTTRVANTSPTAASSGADLNGMAAQMACKAVLGRLKKVAANSLEVNENTITVKDGDIYCSNTKTDLGWKQLVSEAYCSRTNLTAQAFYATPNLHYDDDKERGTPFAYHVFGAAITEVTVDCIRGTYTIDAVHVVHDAGESLNLLIDKGQTEGALLQGIGWMTIEELIYGASGELTTNSLATYKVPDLHFVPKAVNVEFLKDAANPHAVMQSKAIGEPPFMYGIGSYFAIMNALKAYRPEKPAFYNAPLTPEKALSFLHR
nr:molybdopterin-dependent oxidoreductase [PVC group bacterium]